MKIYPKPKKMPDLQTRIQKLEQELSEIKARNKKVETDKAWELSWFRILFLCFLIYIIAVIFMYQIKVENYLLNAFVPALGYFFSTLSLPWVKKWYQHSSISLLFSKP